MLLVLALVILSPSPSNSQAPGIQPEGEQNVSVVYPRWIKEVDQRDARSAFLALPDGPAYVLLGYQSLGLQGPCIHLSIPVLVSLLMWNTTNTTPTIHNPWQSEPGTETHRPDVHNPLSTHEHEVNQGPQSVFLYVP